MQEEGRRFLMAAFAVVMVQTLAAGQQPQTLGTVKKKYLNQEVVVIGDVSSELALQPVLMDWNPASKSGGRYKADEDSYLPATYRGKTATVIAIQLDDATNLMSIT